MNKNEQEIISALYMIVQYPFKVWFCIKYGGSFIFYFISPRNSLDHRF